KELKYDLYEILFEMVGEHDNGRLDSEYGELEEIIYKKKVDVKGGVRELNGRVKRVYKKGRKELGLTFRGEELYL
ncbi:hypothetical protein, partial [Staphylococcus warneri]|uniref:hypothetical protein n=1 Tax=Staphylococcus warneri TaxID=1292 RepID=UPI0016426D8A